MATITVTTNSDTVDAGDGFTSLREAIAQAEAAAGADTIVFDASLAGETIILSHGAGFKALTINSDVTIDGDVNGDNTADITINADRGGPGLPEADFHSVLEITGGNVTLDSLTITGGRALTGGGIDIAAGATVAIDHSTVTGNYVSGQETNSSVAGAGIASAGTLTINNSAIHDNGGGAGTGGDAAGGGIYNTGSLAVSNTTIANNFLEGGQGETLAGNVLTSPGDALGAGLGNAGGSVTLNNVTMTGNVAAVHSAGTIVNLPGGGTMGNGETGTGLGGFYTSGGTAQVANSIILGNVTDTTASEASATGVTWNGLSIVGTGNDTDASDGIIQAIKTGLVFETTADVNTVLGVGGLLADNGGPVKTVKLNDDRYNPAIDASSTGGTAADARSTADHDDSNITNRDTSARDLGAYEVGADTPANAAPTMSGDRAGTMNEGAIYYVTSNDLYATDVDVLDDEQNLTFTVSNQANGVVKRNGTATTTFTAYEVRTGQISFTHNGSEAATAGFDVVVDDGNEDSSDPTKERFNLTVTPVNDKPIINKLIADVNLPIHTDYSFAVANNFKDPEGKLTFTAKAGGAALPTWLKLSSTGTFSLTPPDTVSGTFTIVVTAKDLGGKTVTDTFSIVIPKKPGLTTGADNGADSLTGTSSNNVINAGNGTNTVNSGGGNDKVYTGTGIDKVDLGTGNDTADLGDGNDTASGGAGNDRINVDKGNDKASGGDGNDFIVGGEGNDTISGDAGADFLSGDAGDDVLRGGSGGRASTVAGSLEALLGQSGNDTLFGDGEAEIVLWGGQGNDTIHGGSGDDFLDGDLYVTSDLRSFPNIGGTLVDRASGTGTDKLYGDAGNDAIYGNSGSDTLYGGTGNDKLYGDKFGFWTRSIGDAAVAGNDKLFGDAGNDLLDGGGGNDTLDGGTGVDTLLGGTGDDLLAGGDANDTMTGAAGIDKFKFAVSALAGIDTITDFEVGVDKIQLPALFTGATLAAFGAVQTATDKLIYDSATGALYLDNDAEGTGVAVQFAILGATTHPAITIGDFLFA